MVFHVLGELEQLGSGVGGDGREEVRDGSLERKRKKKKRKKEKNKDKKKKKKKKERKERGELEESATKKRREK